MARTLTTNYLVMLLIRLIWAAAVSISAGLTGQLSTGLAVIVGIWVLLIVLISVAPCASTPIQLRPTMVLVKPYTDPARHRGERQDRKQSTTRAGQFLDLNGAGKKTECQQDRSAQAGEGERREPAEGHPA